MNFAQVTIKRMSTALLAAGLSVAAAAALGQSCPSTTPLFADEFDGNGLDLNKWEVQTGDGCSVGLCGWGNRELQAYRAENAVVADGILTITARKERFGASNYTSARLRTLNRPAGGQWTHGRFEARMKTPKGSGMWPAFWSLPANTTVAWPASAEIDIFESTGQKNMFAWGTLHYGRSNAKHQFLSNQTLMQPGSFGDDFHVYAVVWSANKISWYVDDVLYATNTPADMKDPTDWTFEKYQYYLILNLAVGGDLGGAVDDSALPQTLQVDYVRVYAQPQPSLSGKTLVEPNTSTVYTVVDDAQGDSRYVWTSPTGQSSVGKSLTVNWGRQGGKVSVNVTNSCGSVSKSVDVTVAPLLQAQVVLDDFERNRKIAYTSTTGKLDHASANPARGGLNASPTVAKYVREKAKLYDLVVGTTSAIPDASELMLGQKAFYADIHTRAPVGTSVLLQLENKDVATTANYPMGRHSSYIAYTTKQHGWQRLKFTLHDRLDGATADTAVNQIVLMFSPNTQRGDTYYFDNVGIYGK